MAAQPVVAKYRYIQYTGSNSAELHAEVAMDIVSESGGVLVAFIPANGSQQYTINTGDYVVYFENMIGEIDTSANEFNRRWRCDRTCDQVTAAIATPVRSLGVAPVPTLVASANTTVSVTLDPPMPNSSYVASAKLFAGVNISDLSIVDVTVVDEDTVDVEVENTGLVSLSGSNVLVVATA